MDRTPRPGELYRHFKNKLYQVITVAVHTETGEDMVVYQALYGDFKTFVRPLSMFTGEVDREKYPKAEQKYRFERVSRPGKEEVREQDRESADGEEKTPEPAAENRAEEEPNPYLVKFLEAETPEERLEALEGMAGKVGQGEMDSIREVLDIPPVSGSLEEQLAAISGDLKTRMRYDGTRLR